MVLNSYFQRNKTNHFLEYIWRGGGLRFETGRTQEGGGGGHLDAYCVQQGGWGGLKIGKKYVRN